MAIANSLMTNTISRPKQKVDIADSDAVAIDYDLAIVGGGIVGLTLACSLKSSGLSVALIESQPQRIARQNRRAYAVTLMSGRIFDGLGLWQQMLPKITTFDTIRLADAHCDAVVNLRPSDLGTPELGYVAEHWVFVEALYDSLKDNSSVTCYCPAQLTDIDYCADWVDLTVMNGEQQQRLRTRLLVAADGGRSPIRQQAKIGTVGWPYWQSCVTAVIQPEKPHGHIAREHFWPSGPFATLPLTENRCQIVLTAPHDEAQQFLDMPVEDFLAELDRRYDHQLGRLTLVGDRALFPVKLMHSRHYIRPRLVLVGDAAHGCHPVGGQGLNLGVRDAAALAQVLTNAHRQGRDIGNLKVLKPYENWRRLENWIILGFTDVLDRVFSTGNPAIVLFRRFGLRLMARLGVLKYASLQLMTGMGGRWPTIAKAFSDGSQQSSGLSSSLPKKGMVDAP
ncbi:MAG: FAD-dependent hydroxylase [Cyanobacteria bacterium P01_E01_bin.6]